MMGIDCLLSSEISSQKANKVVEADARATQPGFRLSPSVAKEVACIEQQSMEFVFDPKTDFKERRA